MNKFMRGKKVMLIACALVALALLCWGPAWARMTQPDPPDKDAMMEKVSPQTELPDKDAMMEKVNPQTELPDKDAMMEKVNPQTELPDKDAMMEKLKTKSAD